MFTFFFLAYPESQTTVFSCLFHSDGRYPRPVSQLSFRSKMRGSLFATGRVDTQELLGNLDDSGRYFGVSLFYAN